MMGFTARQSTDGFYATQDACPFSVEAIGDFFAEAPTQTPVAEHTALLREIHSGPLGHLFAGATDSMDGLTMATPPGTSGLPAARFQLCVLHLQGDDVALPILWSSAPESGDDPGDITQGQEVIRPARTAVQPGAIALQNH